MNITRETLTGDTATLYTCDECGKQAWMYLNGREPELSRTITCQPSGCNKPTTHSLTQEAELAA